MGAVVINEFEVVPQAPAAARQDAANAQQPPQGPPPELAREVERTVRRMRERTARLEAD